MENEDQTFVYTYTQDGSLETMYRDDGSGLSILYDDTFHFLAGTSYFDADGCVTDSVTISNDATGKVVIFSEPANETVTYIYDESGNAGYAKENGQLAYRFLRDYETSSKTTFIGDLVSLATSFWALCIKMKAFH